ncbi:PHO85 cyclin-1 [Mycoemilia scoparia]|uniref:PHO85 cyclin-1 n=1 Tax=Mycoemilia scoparia TaxID=417184 RepID=A0A9W7ZZT4_9FUNG|nr:PHO85 cyclin-1 [Mycoemilia scoparia]
MPQPQFYSHETLVPIPKRAEHVSKPRSTTARNAMNHPLGSQRQSHSIQSSNQYQSRKSLGYLPQHHSHYQQQQILPPIIVPIQMPVPLPSHQHSAISRPAYNMPAPIHHPHSQHATMPHCAPIRGATQVQRLAQQTIFEVPQSLVDSIISSFKSRLEPLQEMQYKHMKNPHTASPNHTDPSLAYPDLATFVSRFLADNRIPVMVLAHTLIYLDRFSKRLTKRSTACQSAPHLTFLAAILVATKYCDDLCMMTSRDISRQFNGLFSIQDVSRIERSFMSIIKYKLYVEPKELDPILRKHHIDKKKLLAATHVAPP